MIKVKYVAAHIMIGFVDVFAMLRQLILDLKYLIAYYNYAMLKIQLLEQCVHIRLTVKIS